MKRLFKRWIGDKPKLSDREIIIAYQLLLEREPDPGGLANFKRHAQEGMDLATLRSHIVQSAEYISRNLSSHRQTIDIGRALVVVDANEAEFGRHIAQHGSWEPHILAILKQHLKPGDVFVDVGANVGVMAFTAAALVGDRGKVIAFEPLPANIQNFVFGISANKFDNVTLYGFGLSSEQAVFSIYGSSNGFLMPGGDNTVQVAALPGDPLLANEPRIDLVKLDIEGHEPQALQGLDATLRRHRPMLLLEFNPRTLREHGGTDPFDFARAIFQLTNKVEIIEHSGILTEIKSAESLMEVWQDQNQKAVATGWLPDGLLHFDLLFKVYPDL